MSDDTLDLFSWQGNEDYTDAVCLLHGLTKKYPTYHEILVDADDLAYLSQWKWHLVAVSRDRGLRVVNTGFEYLHRVIMQPPVGMTVDHIRHRPLDNRRKMMRICTQGENNINSRGIKNGSSRFKGVWRNKPFGRWYVRVGPRTSGIYLGAFDDEIDAAKAYNEHARRFYGDKAYLNPV